MRTIGLFLLLVGLCAVTGCGSLKHRNCCHPGQCQQCGGCDQCGMPCRCGGGLLNRACGDCNNCDIRAGVHGCPVAQPSCERCGLFERLWGDHCGGRVCRHCGGRGCHLCRGGAGGPGGPGGPGGHGDPMGLGPAPAPPQSAAAVGYPYYTNRGPRDFLLNNPPSIGPY